MVKQKRQIQLQFIPKWKRAHGKRKKHKSRERDLMTGSAQIRCLVKSVMPVRASFITKCLFVTSQKRFNGYRKMLIFQYYEFWMSLALYNITLSNFVNLIQLKSHRDVKQKNAAQGRRMGQRCSKDGRKKETLILGLFWRGGIILIESNSIKNISIKMASE